MRKLILYLPENLHEKIKTQAAQEHIPLSIFVRLLITGKMKLSEEKQDSKTYSSKPPPATPPKNTAPAAPAQSTTVKPYEQVIAEIVPPGLEDITAEEKAFYDRVHSSRAEIDKLTKEEKVLLNDISKRMWRSR